MSGTTLGLLRHGQTDWNIDLRLQGTTDIPMNQAGIDQIQRACLHLGEWDVVISSSLGRARHSAQLVAEHLGIQEVAIEPLLMERSFGIGEGLTYAQWQEDYSSLDQIPGAESKDQVIIRAKLLLEHLRESYSGQRVLAVSHGALIRFVLGEVTSGEVPPAGERLQNASLHILRHREDWTLDAWAPQPLGS